MNNMAMTNLNNANTIVFMQLKNIVESQQRFSMYNSPVNPNFFGDWIYPLIISENISGGLLRRIIEYIDDEQVYQKNRNLNEDDYHTHLAFVYLTLRNYSDAVKELELIKKENFGTLIQKWKSFSALLQKAEDNYKPLNLLNAEASYPSERETYECRKAVLLATYEKEFVCVRVRWQSVVRFWDDIPASKIAFSECCSTIEFTCTFFERYLVDVASSKEGYNNQKMIGPLIEFLEGAGFLDPVGKNEMKSISDIRRAEDLRNCLNELIEKIKSFDTYEKYASALLYLCHKIRNCCSHKMDLEDCLFENKEEFKNYIKILFEGILLLTAI